MKSQRRPAVAPASHRRRAGCPDRPLVMNSIATPAARRHRSPPAGGPVHEGAACPTPTRPGPPQPTSLRRPRTAPAERPVRIDGLRRQGDHRPRGSRGRAQAPRHVHRLHRRARPAPPGLRDRRQRGGRVAGRLRRHHRRHPPRRRRRPRQGQRPRHPHRHPPAEKISAVELVLTQLHAGGKFGGGGYKVSGGLHGVGSSVVNALSTRLEVAVRQKGHVFRMSFTDGVPDGPLEQQEAPDRTDRHDDHLLGQRRHLRDRRLRLRDDPGPDAADGLPQQGPEDQPRRRADRASPPTRATSTSTTSTRTSSVEDRRQDDESTAGGAGQEGQAGHLPLRQRPRRLRQPPRQQQEQRAGAPRGHLHRGRGRGPLRSPRARDAVDQRLQRVGAHLRQRDQHPRGRHPRGGLPRGDDQARQRLRAQARTCSRRRTRTSPATTSARASPPSSRSSSPSRSSRARPRPSSATPRSRASSSAP